MPDVVSTARIDPVTGRVTFTGTQETLAPLPVSSAATYTPTIVRSVGGRNIGLGTRLFAGVDGVDDTVLTFKTVLAGDGLRLVDGDDTITIEASGVNARFTDLLDGPRGVVSNALLVGVGDRLDWSPAPDTPDLILRWTGGNFQWVRRTTGTVTEVRTMGQDGVTITSGSLINTTGTIAIGLVNSPVTPGTYQNATVVVDSKGRIVSASSNSSGEVNVGQSVGSGVSLYAGKTGANLLFRSLRGNDPITVEQNGNSVDVAIVPTGVTAGSYTYSSITVDQFGRITSAASGTTLTGIDVRQGSTRVPSAQTVIFTGDVSMTVPSGGTAQLSFGGTSLTGLNNSVTAGAQVFRNTIDRVGVLRRITGSGTVTVTEQTDSILIAGATGVIGVARNGSVINAAATTINFAGLGAVTTSGATATISTPSPANIGAGARVYAANTGTDLQFRSIVAGSGITVTENAESIAIATVGGVTSYRLAIQWAFAQPGVWSFGPTGTGVSITRNTDFSWTVTHAVDGPPIGLSMIGLGSSGWVNHGSNFIVTDSNAFNFTIPTSFGYGTSNVSFSRVIVRFIV